MIDAFTGEPVVAEHYFGGASGMGESTNKQIKLSAGRDDALSLSPEEQREVENQLR